MNCVDCDNEIRRGSEYWTEVIGWEKQRVQGGTNHIADRKPTGRAVCVPCMHLRQSGISGGQDKML